MILIFLTSLALPPALYAQMTTAEADDLLLKAQTAYNNSDFNAALELLSKAQASYEKSAPGDGAKKAVVALWRGASCFKVNDYDESIRQFEQALALFKTAHDDASQVAAINGLANTCLALKKYDMIIDYYKQAVTIFDKAGNKEFKAVYVALIAGYYYQLQKPKEAIEYYSAAADLYSALKNDREVFNNLNNVAGVYFYSGQKEKALEYYKRAYETGKRILAPAEAVSFLNNIATIAREVKKYGDAAAFFQLIYDLIKNSGGPHDVYLACENLGAAYYLDAKKELALKYYSLALGAGREKLEPAEMIDILSRIADTAAEVKDFKTAVSTFEELAKLYRDKKAWKELAYACNSLGIVSHESGADTAAIDYLKQAEDIADQIKDPEILSAVYFNTGRAYDTLAQYKLSLAYLKKYIAGQANTNEKGDLINACLLAGSACFHQSLFPEALAFYGQAEKIAAGYAKKEFLVSVYQYYAELYERTAEYTRALDCYRNALALCEKPGLASTRAVILSDTGSIYKDLEDYDKALDYYNQALKLNKSLGNEKEIATVNNNIGQMYYLTGAFDKALAYMNLGLAYYEKSPDKKNYAIALNNVGDVYRLWGTTEQALRYYNAAVKIAAELELADVRATVANNLGMLYKEKEEFPKALDFFNQALALNREAADKALVSINLSNIGETYRQLRDYKKANGFFLEALAIDKELGIKSKIANRLNGLALLSSDNGDYTKSNDYLRDAMQYAGASSKVDLSTYYGNMGFNYAQLRQYDPAIENLNKAVALKEELRKTAQGTSRMDYLASQIFTYQVLIYTYASAGNLEKALEVMEMSRAKYLAEKLSSKRGSDAAYPGLAKIIKSIDDDTIIISFSNVGRYLFPLRTIITRQKVVINELNPDALPIGKASMDEIKAANGKTRGLKVVAAGPAAWRKDASTANSGYFYDTLSNVIYHFRSLLSDPSIDFLGKTRANEIAKALYGFFIGDLKELLAAKKKIIIIPDNILGLLPFETLIDGDNRYLVETHDVQYEHSLTVMNLVNVRRYADNRRPVLAFGGAVYDDTSGVPADASLSETELKETAVLAGRGQGSADIYAYVRNAAWQNLPGTLAEVTNIGKIFGTATVITGDKVSEENVKALSKRGELDRYRIIHFATHGLTVPDYPELSSLVLSFSGANKKSGDGYLQAPEIATLDIKADFVNLSACETGLGKIYGGEGIVGLSQSFIIAGANSISVSLWAVADEPTTRFMTDFYKLIKDKKMTYAAAESAIKRTFIKDPNYRQPYYWAPFVYYGK
jgi:pentatricopeptide repeat protein